MKVKMEIEFDLDQSWWLGPDSGYEEKKWLEEEVLRDTSLCLLSEGEYVTEDLKVKCMEIEYEQ